MWRYHHQVSHHIHCNDNSLDQDVHTVGLSVQVASS
jgi:fatty acid desaturase (delta-4 desaturase)